MLRTTVCPTLFFAILAAAPLPAAAPRSAPAEPVVERILELGPVWSGHPVAFCLLTHEGRQYAAYYDDQRRMTVAARRLTEKEWSYTRLPETIKWDSHNYVTMAVDATGHLHLSGNMHCVPLVYFRTEKSGDIQTFKRLAGMVGREEKRATYPRFLKGSKGELIFTYRDGGSGNGNQIFNVYDPQTRTWRRLLDTPLTDGEGQMNAYLDLIQRDRKGVFHLCWIWRDTPDCATNHDICYARSRDLVHWERSDGTPLKLPMTLKGAEIVDPVPAGGGALNGNVRLGFDAQDRPVISFYKFDEKGITQTYNARRESGRWQAFQVSAWDYRYVFSGGGSIGSEIRIGPVKAEPDGRLVQTFRHSKAGSGRWVLESETLKRIATLPAVPKAGAALSRVESKVSGMSVRWAVDEGRSGEPGVGYMLRWETLPANRDRAREGPPPAPTMLRLVKVREVE
ncbi:MAG TPA: BNR repeat-containing protein [Phycisphaerae bacterium]|nr:BNR repeat-containing protein [Phycisphaerae bacterium]HRY68364.1 BNR repeat-containing protein [Phycisphaerae bacterium]HSA28303.1 BNR repeat-containing protein [Phycisphaerae bacterium]